MKPLRARKLIFPAIFAAAVLLSAFFGGLPQADAAFGISPPFFNANHLVAGATYEQAIYLVRDNADADLPIQATLEIPDEVRSWISVEQGMSFVIPQGTRQFPVKVSVSVPKNVDLGVWSGTLRFVSAPAKAGSGGQAAAIAIGAQVAINIRVGTDIYESFQVPLVHPLDIEEGWNPQASVRFENDGNVPETLSAATLEVLDKFSAVRLAYTQKTSGFPPTPPFTTKEYTLEFPLDFHLGVGDYWGSVNLYQGDKLIANAKTIFHVLPAGSIKGSTARFLNSFGGYWYAWAAGTALVAAGWFLRRRRKSAARRRAADSHPAGNGQEIPKG